MVWDLKAKSSLCGIELSRRQVHLDCQIRGRRGAGVPWSRHESTCARVDTTLGCQGKTLSSAAGIKLLWYQLDSQSSTDGR